MKAKQLLLSLAFCMLGMMVLKAQVPQGITYQAVARDNNVILTNQTLDVRFTLREGGVDQYQEVHTILTNGFGIFTAVIGEGSPISGSFSGINWSTGNINLRVELDNGSGFINMGIVPMKTVPYSFYAERAAGLDNINFGIGDLADVIAPAPAPGEILKWDGTMWVASPDGGGLSAGTGISVINDTIVNTGDIDATDDITDSTLAQGDLSGFYINPTVTGIQGRNISAAFPAVGEVLKWNGTEWAPGTDLVSSGGGGGGAVNTTARISGDGSNTPLDIAQQGANIGQVLKWNGASWAPANDSTTIPDLELVGNILTIYPGGDNVVLPFVSYTAGAGISILGNVISNIGDTDASDDITIGFPASGDLSGVFPAPSVIRLRGNAISANPPANGQILKFSAGQWQPSVDATADADADPTNEIQTLTLSGSNTLSLSLGGGSVSLPTYVAGTGISLTNTGNGIAINNTGDLNPFDDVLIGASAGGDLGGQYPNPSVVRLQGNPVANAVPSAGEVLRWNGSQWLPGTNDDADSDPNNEIQTLSLNNGVLTLSNGGSSVNLPIYTGGPGITVNGTTIINDGDLDGTDDIIIGSTAGGDLAGTYPNPSVKAVQGQAFSNTIPATGQVLKWTGSQWAPSTDLTEDGDVDSGNELQALSITGNTISLNLGGGSVNLPVYTAGSGIDITNNIVTNTGDLNGGDDINIGSTAGGDLAGTYPNPNVVRLNGNAVANTIPSNGEILKWNGTQWAPGNDDDTGYTAGAGIDLTGNVVTNTGDIDDTDDLIIGSIAGGDLTGTLPNPTVASVQGQPFANSAPTTGQVLKWNGAQWEAANDSTFDGDASPVNELQDLSITGNVLSITGANSVNLPVYTAGTGINITGNVVSNTGDLNGLDDINIGTIANGDLAGTYPNPTVDGLQGNPVSSTAPANGQILKWSGTQWVPSGDDNTTYTAGTGISISSGVITNTGDTNAGDDITNISAAGGDASGTFSALTVTGIQGSDVSSTAPTNGQILKWSGTQWVPNSDDNTTYSAGTGINIAGGIITNTGDTNAGDDITTSSTAGGDASGTFGALSVVRIQGNEVSSTAPSSGQILKWNGAQWVPDSDENTTYTGGTGISIAGGVVTNTGDTNAGDDITTSSAAGGDASGTFGGLTVTGIQGNTVAATAPSSGQILKWNGTQWVPDSDDNTTYTGGTGISIAGGVVTNTGDTNAGDDITTSSTAGGDASGTFGGLTVTGIQGNAVSSTAPSTGQVLKWSGTQWVPDTDGNTAYVAGTGISLAGNIVTNTGDTDASDDITTASTAGGDASGTFSGLTVTGIQGNGVSSTAPSAGQILKWSGTQWVPNSDDNTTYTGGTGISIAGGIVTNTGDTNAGDDITSGSAAGGDLNGTYPNPTVAGLQGNAVSNTAPASGQVLKWNGTQWAPGSDDGVSYSAGTGITISAGNVITNAGDTNASDDITTGSTAGGDLSGTFPNPTVAQLQGNAVSSTAPTAGQILKWSGSQWVPNTDDNTTYTGGTGITISGGVVTNTGDTDASDDLTTSSTAGGDASGTFSALSVTALQGNAVANTTPSSGQVLKWNGTQWVPDTDNGDTYTAGTGISLIAGVIANTGDTDASDDLTNTSNAGGDASGTFSGLTVTGLQGNAVSNTIPASGEVLKWNGTQWAPGTDTGGTINAGTGISVSGSTITNIGDTDSTNDITNTTAAGGDLSGTYPNPTVAQLQGNAVAAVTPTSGQVLKWSGTQWVPNTDDNTTYTGGTGINVSGTTIINTGDTDASDDLTTSSTAGGDASGAFSALTVTGIQGSAVSSTAPSSGQVLKWSGTQWVPNTDDNTTYTAGTGISIAAGVITNSGDTDASDDLTTSSTAGGDASGAFSALTVTGIQGSAVSSTAPSSGQVLKWSGTQWVPNTDDNTTYTGGAGITVSGTTIINSGDTDASDDLTTSSTAGGDASGAFSALTVTGIQGSAVSSTAPSSGQVLKWSGTQWVPNSDDNTTYTAGTGISITAGVVANTGDTDASDDITTSSTAGGDASGTFSALTVTGLQGNAVANTVPTTDYVLKWNGSQWAPAIDDDADADADATNELQTISLSGSTVTLSDGGGSFAIPPTLTAGDGIAISSNTIINIGDQDSTNDITNTTAAGGDLTGTYPNPTIANLQGETVTITAPANNDVLSYNGTAWVNSQDVDRDTTNEIQILGLLANKLYLSDGAGSSDTVTIPTAAPVYLPGAGIDTLTGGVVLINTGDRDSTDDITNTTAAGGDLTGTYPNPTIASLQGETVTITAPAADEVLKYNGTAWVNSSDTDTDPTNELQTLSVSGTNVSISGGNSIALPYSGGSGIALSGSTIINVGDTDASDDITTATSAGGDLSGTYPNPTVAQIQGNAVANTAPADGQILKWNNAGSQWVPAADDDGSATAVGTDLSGTVGAATVVALRNRALSTTAPTDGQVLSWDATNSEWVPAADNDGSGTAVGTDLSGTVGAATVVAIRNRTVSTTAPTDGQILKWNNAASQWVPSADDDGASTAVGTDLSGTVGAATVVALRNRALSTTAPADGQVLAWDNTNSEWVPTTDNDGSGTAVGTDLSGTVGAATVVALRNRALSTTAPTDGQVLAWDASGSEWVPTTENDGSGTAVGTDLSGTVGAATVVALRNRALSTTAPTDGQVLAWDNTNSEWVPAADNDGSGTAVGTDLSGTVGAATVVALRNRALSTTAPADGQVLAWDNTNSEWVPTADNDGSGTAVGTDLSGTVGAATVVALRNRTISTTAPTDGQILKWNNAASQWVPSADDDGASTAVGTDLSGTVGAATVVALRNRALSTNAPTDGQVLAWDNTNSEWVPTTDNDGSGTAVGTDLSGTVGAATVIALRNRTISTATPDNGEIMVWNNGASEWQHDSLSVTQLAVDGHMVPDADATHDLGSGSFRYRDAYVANGITTTSDFRAKSNIEELTYGLDEVMKLRPVSYNWKGQEGEQKKIGLIAQEVLPVLEEVVNAPVTSESAKEELYGLYYSDLIPVLIKAMQEQEQNAAQQQTLIQKQTELIEKLEQRINELEKKEQNEK